MLIVSHPQALDQMIRDDLRWHRHAPAPRPAGWVAPRARLGRALIAVGRAVAGERVEPAAPASPLPRGA